MAQIFGGGIGCKPADQGRCIVPTPKAVCIRPVSDPFACSEQAYLVGVCVNNEVVYSFEYPLGTPIAGAYPTWEQLPVSDCRCKDVAPKFDREFAILCAPDGTKVITQNVTPEDAPLGTAPVIEAWTLAGAPYAGNINALTDCGSEKFDLTAAESYCAAGVGYSRIDIVDLNALLVVGNIWLDDTGTMVAAPTGAIKGECAELASDAAMLVQLTAINANTDTVEPLLAAANTTLAAMLAEQDKHLTIASLQVCVNNAGTTSAWLKRSTRQWDAEAAAFVGAEIFEYSNDVGNTWTTTVPSGVVTLGACPPAVVPCEPKIIAVEVGHTKDATAFAGYTGYTFKNFPTLTSDFPSATYAERLYIHAISFGSTGNMYGLDGAIFTAYQTPILWSQAQGMIDKALVAEAVSQGLPANTYAGSVIIDVDVATGQPMTWVSLSQINPSEITFWGGGNGNGNVENKIPTDTTYSGAQPVPAYPYTYRNIEVVKSLQCDGTITVVLYEKDGTLIAPQPLFGDWFLGVYVAPPPNTFTRNVISWCVENPTDVFTCNTAELVREFDATHQLVSSKFTDANNSVVIVPAGWKFGGCGC